MPHGEDKLQPSQLRPSVLSVRGPQMRAASLPGRIRAGFDGGRRE